MPSEFSPYEVIDGDFSKGLLIICDHASNNLPNEYGTLGLPPSEFERHIAYDIGAEGVARGLAQALNIPAVLSTYSRLLIDPNRGEDDPTLIRQLYDGTIIPGNYPLADDERDRRLNQFFRPYHGAIEQMLSAFEARGIVPAIFSVHTMTDSWNGEKRPWQSSVLWDMDPRFSLAMREALSEIEGMNVGDNQPYDGALNGDTLFRHATQNGLSNVLLEIRQDLVRDIGGIREWVNLLAPIVEKVNADPHNHERRFFGTRTGMELEKHYG